MIVFVFLICCYPVLKIILISIQKPNGLDGVLGVTVLKHAVLVPDIETGHVLLKIRVQFSLLLLVLGNPYRTRNVRNGAVQV